MTICNMSIEGGARVGHVNPDDTTFAYIKGRRFAPAGDAFDRAVAWWRSMATAPEPITTTTSSSTPARSSRRDLGINPGQSVAITEPIDASPDDEAFAFMGFTPGTRVQDAD